MSTPKRVKMPSFRPFRSQSSTCALTGQYWSISVAENAGDVVVEDEFFLVDAFEQAAAQAVDGLALLVHDVVVFEQVFAGFEVLRLRRLSARPRCGA